MSNTEVSKRVVFAGVWRSQSVNDQLLRQIGNQNSKKTKQIKGSPAVLNLNSERLDILIYDDKGALERTDQVPLQDIVELSANKYAATSLFAIVRDNVNKQFYIFVFQCASDNDAAEIIQGYGRVKQRLSGEGFNTDIKPGGTNWLLQSKEEQEANSTSNGHARDIQLKPTQNGDVRILSSEREEGETKILVGGKTPASPMAGDHVSVSESEMREELNNLAGELRDIKVMLNKSHGRHNFEKHYKYLIQGSGSGNNKAHFTEHVVVDGNRPTETEVRYRPGSQVHYRNTVVQPASQGQQYRTTIVQPSTQAQQYRTTVVRPVSQVQRPRTTVIQPSSHVQHYKTTTIQHAPQIQHFKSTRSTTSSLQSGYTKSVHDSVNPALEMNRRYIQNQPRVVTVRKELVANQRNAPEALVFHSPSDKVTRRIEQVYKPRSYRMHAIPPARPTAEYVVVGDRPRNPVAVVHQTDDDKVKYYINENKTEYGRTDTNCEPMIRHTYENKDYDYEEVSVQQPTVTVTEARRVSVQQPTVTVIEAPTEKSVHYEEYTHRDDNEEISERTVSVQQPTVTVTEARRVSVQQPIVTVIEAPTEKSVHYEEYTHRDDNEAHEEAESRLDDKYETLSTEKVTSQEENHSNSGNDESNVRYIECTTKDTIEPVELVIYHEKNNTTVHEEYTAHNGDEIVIKANTDVYKSVDEGENTAQRQSKIINNDVYYIRAEGLDQFNRDRSEDLQEIQKEDDVVLQSTPDRSEDGLWESYAEKTDENAGSAQIISERAHSYHDSDANEDENEDGTENGVVQEKKRVHYMEELERTIGSNRDEDDDRYSNQDDMDRNENDDEEDDYVLNEEEMKQFIMSKDVIVVDKSD